MHSWGNWPDESFNQVEDAASFIGDYISKYGRIMVSQTKEKFGTVRVYCHFGFSCFHALIWPRHCWIHEWWPYSLDLKISGFMARPINYVLGKWQTRIYKMAYKKALSMWPHLREEILCCADWGELLEDL